MFSFTGFNMPNVGSGCFAHEVFLGFLKKKPWMAREGGEGAARGAGGGDKGQNACY
jgi:hypothetical protein